MSESKLYIRCVDRQSYNPIKPHKNFEFYAYDKGPEKALNPASLDVTETHAVAAFKHEESIMVAILLREADEAYEHGARERQPIAVACLRPGAVCYIDVFCSYFWETVETTIVRVNVYECAREHHPKRRFTGNGTVLATPVLVSKPGERPARPSGSNAFPIAAPIRSGGIATFSVSSGGLYELSLNITDQYAGTRPKFPIPLFVCGCELVELDVCIEVCTRRLMVLLTDSCGHKVAGACVEIDEHKYDSNEHGTFVVDLGTVDTQKKTSLAVRSEKFEVEPQQIEISEALAQAVVLQLSKRGFAELLVQVTDEVGNPSANTQVVFQPVAGGEPFSARSDSRGLIRKAVPKGDYLMTTPGTPSDGSEVQAVVTAG